MAFIKENWQKQIKEIAKFPILGKKNMTEKEEKYLREIDTYEFFNLENPGLMLKFGYGCGKDNCSITLMHGGRYQLPRFLVKHLESKALPIYKWKPDYEGHMIKQKIGTNPRFRLSMVMDD